MNPDAAAKIKMMKASLRCLFLGLLGLLPVIGLPFAILALVTSGTVRSGQKFYWNPARPYWLSGVICAALGTIFWSFILTIILYHAVYPY
jgi:hypothetical protein